MAVLGEQAARLFARLFPKTVFMGFCGFSAA
jgi:hypothetical protein